MVRTAELAERLDVRLHTHLAEDPDEDRFAAEKLGQRTIDHFEAVGWMTDRSWVAHCIYPDPAEVARLGARRRRRGALPELEHDDRRRGHRSGRRPARRGLAGRARLRRLVVHRLRVALDGGAQRDAARPAARRTGIDRGTRRARDRDPRRCGLPRPRPARSACSRSGAVGDLVVWPVDGDIVHAGALSDPIEAWLRCGPSAARHTVVAGRAIVRDGALVSDRVDEMLAWHRRVAERFQAD